MDYELQYMNYRIEIKEEDLALEDTELFLKIYNDLEDKNEVLPSLDSMTKEITREINLAKKRKICHVCDGTAFLANFPCYECNARGYKI
jgi:hypothetical protein